MSCRDGRSLEISQKTLLFFLIGVALDRRELSLYGETVDICSEIHTKRNALCEQTGHFFFILNLAVRKITTRLCEGLIQAARATRTACLLAVESQTPASFFLCGCRNWCRTLGICYTDVWSFFKRLKLVTRKMCFIYFIFGFYVWRFQWIRLCGVEWYVYRWITNWRGFGNNWSWPILSCCSRSCLEGLLRHSGA